MKEIVDQQMTQHPLLCAAFALIAYDSGMVNRYCTEGYAVRLMYARAGALHTLGEMGAAEQELSKLPQDEIYELCCGEAGGEQTCSATLDAVLNHAFGA